MPVVSRRRRGGGARGGCRRAPGAAGAPHARGARGRGQARGEGLRHRGAAARKDGKMDIYPIYYIGLQASRYVYIYDIYMLFLQYI